MRLIVVAVLVVLAVAGAVLVWPSVDAYARAIAVTSDAVLRWPVRPLSWVTPDPVVEEFHWERGGVGVLTRPPGAERHPGIVLVLGAEPAEADDARVVRLTDALSRAGFVVLLPRTEGLIDGKVGLDEAALTVDAFRALQGYSAVDPDRVSFVGLSVGASLAMIAASDPVIADHVLWVLAIGPYADAGRLAAEVLSRQYRAPDGSIQPWEPDPTATRVVTRTVLDALAEAEAAVPGFEENATAQASEAAARELLAGTTLERAEQLVGALGRFPREVLDSLSPAAQVASLRAPLYLLHDRHDRFIPWTHSEELARLHQPEAYYQLELFAHVDPNPGDVRIVARDARRLVALFAELIRAST